MIRRASRTPIPPTAGIIPSGVDPLSLVKKGKYLPDQTILRENLTPQTRFMNDFDVAPSTPGQRPQAAAPSLSVMDVINARESEIETEISRIKAMIVDIANLEDELVKVRAAKAALMGYTPDSEIVEPDVATQKKPRKRRTNKQREMDAAFEAEHEALAYGDALDKAEEDERYKQLNLEDDFSMPGLRMP